MASNKSSAAQGIMLGGSNAMQGNAAAGVNALGPKINAQKRVIKQIVSIDSKKLKELGIESNILSAMNKFSGEFFL